ncbi:16S rRNA (cytosine(967)-C(5))-methyltransferase RsmB [Thermomonas paludicola]|uniref:16S rRNA (cytosine(967)-C(5))-methyltransferase RsmB n=1 Tax=Thermomonas paludicola TaxID=2884874 RepID=UPI00211471A1|nr:16S rRNA (cytosine(967)-C(5))-methyltransferase RsmB [Thermomonas paludicola]
MSDGVAARTSAAGVLDAVLHHGRSLKAALAAALPTLDDVRDRALVEAIVLGALRRRAAFNAALDGWLPRPLGGRDGALRSLLLAGFAQLEMGLPAHAAVAATVDAARAMGRTHQAGMVNALLRRAQREGLPASAPGDEWPHWLAQQVRVDWPQQAESVFSASAQAAPMWLRIHRGITTRQAYLATLHDAGIQAHADAHLPDAIRLDTPLPVQQLPGFSAGAVSVQDGAAQAVADALAAPAGARVLDACAAPGGKAAHLAERDTSLRITALDMDARRVRRMQETFARLQLVGIDARAADAIHPDDWWDGTPFDAILIDAPCSASGIVRRQPDVLLHRRASDIAALAATQAGLLDALWPLLAQGGVLVYATCSILRAENTAQIAAFLARTPGAVIEPLGAHFGHDTGTGSQRFPGDGGMDGFFCARLRKQ